MCRYLNGLFPPQNSGMGVWFLSWSFSVDFWAVWYSIVCVIGTQKCPGMNSWFIWHLAISLHWSSATFASCGFKQEEILQNQYSEMLHMQVRLQGRESSSSGGSFLAECHWAVERKEKTWVNLSHFAELSALYSYKEKVHQLFSLQ